jgi:SAM-dependent methyltransferase
LGKGAILRKLENSLLARHLRGTGIEIGALWRTFPVRPGTVVWHVDRCDAATLKQHYPQMGEIIVPHVIADAAALPFVPASLDFVIASHVLEHLPFPLRALRNWYEALRPGGVLVLKIPDKRYTFDVHRARTSLQHLIEEDCNPAGFDKRAHFEDWVRFVGAREAGSELLRDETNDLVERDYSIHYHVWTDADVREILNHTRAAMGMKWTEVLFLPARFYRKECAVALRKRG